jgi:hypothetical protein
LLLHLVGAGDRRARLSCATRKIVSACDPAGWGRRLADEGASRCNLGVPDQMSASGTKETIRPRDRHRSLRKGGPIRVAQDRCGADGGLYHGALMAGGTHAPEKPGRGVTRPAPGFRVPTVPIWFQATGRGGLFVTEVARACTLDRGCSSSSRQAGWPVANEGASGVVRRTFRSPQP